MHKASGYKKGEESRAEDGNMVEGLPTGKWIRMPNIIHHHINDEEKFHKFIQVFVCNDFIDIKYL